MILTISLSGLRLTLNIHRDEYIGMFSHSVGAKVSIHPPTVEPFPEDDGIAAAPGLQTSIGTKMVTFSSESILRFPNY